MSVQQPASRSDALENDERVAGLERLMRRLHASNRVAITVLSVITALVSLLFLIIILYLVVQGVPYLINPDFYGSAGTGTIGQQIFNTFYILILTEIILIPISLAAAIYLTEYAPQGRLLSIIHFASDTLAGVPSIVLGLFGYLVFSTVLGFSISRLSGALTLLCLNFPLTLRLFEDALVSVPREMREGGLALGTTKWHTIRTVVLPSALPGIVTGVVLSAGKIIGEAAALIYTMGSTNPYNVYTLNPLVGSDTLTIHIWYLKTSGAGLTANVQNAVSAGSSALLVLILLLINLGARAIGRVIQRRFTAV